jgi:hypothetical protein
VTKEPQRLWLGTIVGVDEFVCREIYQDGFECVERYLLGLSPQPTRVICCPTYRDNVFVLRQRTSLRVRHRATTGG